VGRRSRACPGNSNRFSVHGNRRDRQRIGGCGLARSLGVDSATANYSALLAPLPLRAPASRRVAFAARGGSGAGGSLQPGLPGAGPSVGLLPAMALTRKGACTFLCAARGRALQPRTPCRWLLGLWRPGQTSIYRCHGEGRLPAGGRSLAETGKKGQVVLRYQRESQMARSQCRAGLRANPGGKTVLVLIAPSGARPCDPLLRRSTWQRLLAKPARIGQTRGGAAQLMAAKEHSCPTGSGLMRQFRRGSSWRGRTSPGVSPARIEKACSTRQSFDSDGTTERC